MRLHRFFIEEQLRNKKEISLFDTDVIHQLKDVFRMRAGDRLILLDNSGLEFLSEIVMIARGEAQIKIVENNISENMPNKDNEIWLFAALIKKDNYEWILEKCTEIGVSHFVPVVSDRTEKKDLNIERAQKIIKEASEQSGRGMMPILHDVQTFEEALALGGSTSKLKPLVFHSDVEAQKFDSRKLLNKQSDLEKSLGIPQEKTSYAIFIGPEGGWTDKEVALFAEKNIPLYSLGPQVLRAETAAIVISGLLLM